MNWNLIHKYLAGECSRRERLTFEHWLEADVQNRDFFQSVKQIWNISPQRALNAFQLETLVKDDDAAWEQFKGNNIDFPQQSGLLSQPGTANTEKYHSIWQRKRFLQKPILYTAAAVLLLVALIVVFQQNTAGPAAQIVQHEFVSGEGEHINLKLSDGTEVTLNENSRIIINDSFTPENRKAYLEGEAFFEVEHDPQHPFIVDLGEARVKVLGTKFNVNSRNNSDRVKVAVIEGRVSLQGAEPDNQSGIILTKNNLGVYNLVTENFRIENTRAANFLSWMTGRLVFKNNSLSEVSRQLEYLYNVQIEFENSELHARRLSASLEKKELRSVLDVIAKTLAIDYSIEKQQVIWRAEQAEETGSPPNDNLPHN